jgi:hypothetical protein
MSDAQKVWIVQETNRESLGDDTVATYKTKNGALKKATSILDDWRNHSNCEEQIDRLIAELGYQAAEGKTYMSVTPSGGEFFLEVYETDVLP